MPKHAGARVCGGSINHEGPIRVTATATGPHSTLAGGAWQPSVADRSGLVGLMEGVLGDRDHVVRRGELLRLAPRVACKGKGFSASCTQDHGFKAEGVACALTCTLAHTCGAHVQSP